MVATELPTTFNGPDDNKAHHAVLCFGTVVSMAPTSCPHAFLPCRPRPDRPHLLWNLFGIDSGRQAAAEGGWRDVWHLCPLQRVPPNPPWPGGSPLRCQPHVCGRTGVLRLATLPGWTGLWHLTGARVWLQVLHSCRLCVHSTFRACRPLPKSHSSAADLAWPLPLWARCTGSDLPARQQLGGAKFPSLPKHPRQLRRHCGWPVCRGGPAPAGELLPQYPGAADTHCNGGAWGAAHKKHSCGLRPAVHPRMHPASLLLQGTADLSNSCTDDMATCRPRCKQAMMRVGSLA